MGNRPRPPPKVIGTAVRTARVAPWPTRSTSAGGALQIFGVALVLREIFSNLRTAGRYHHRDVTVYVPTLAASAAVGLPTIQVTTAPPLEDRLAALEAGLAAARRDLQELPVALRREWNDDLAAATDRVAGGLSDRDNALEKVLLDVAEGRRWARILGTVAILAGIGLSTAGAVLR